MQSTKKTKILIVILALLLVLPLIKIKTIDVNAAENFQYMTSSTGQELKYRGSSEKVKGLKEYNYPTQQYRAAWVSTFVGDIPSFTSETSFKSDATTILDNMEKMGMNAIVFHVRTHNNALYNSNLNPIASWWKKVNFDVFDPLEWLITECHNRGFEFHAWMNPYRVNSNSAYVGEDYPEGHPCNDSSQILTSSSGAQILNPGSTKVQDFIVDTCMEFLEKYDADAIHFDDYFYISGVATDLSGDQKRANVDSFIKKLSDSIHEMNEREGRAVQLGISPSGIYRNTGYAASPSYDSNGSLISPIGSNTSGFAHYDDYLYSDTKKWIDNEWIDYITPQTYWGMEHTGANFYELSRWWSWCVKYKKNVNLYLGMGVYMPDSTGSSGKYWQRNQDEVKNQLLNAGIYEEIKGLCLYKYGSLLSDNTIIKKGVDLITNDYWSKRIPGAVIHRYANSIPSEKVTNIMLNGTTLSWDKQNNIYGYMVYQVPKGQTLDQNNIDHVMVYTQNTEVANINTLSYDYYISSVNRANVISTPVKFGQANKESYEIVIDNIKLIPSEITLDNELLITNIRSAYEKLSTEDKNKVYNIQVLIDAENIIKVYKDMKKEVDSFISTINKHINTNRILPVKDSMKWTYKNVDDANEYNISTGKRLKNYLTTVNIPLILEYTKNGYVYKQEVVFDLSLLKEGQSALIYRNDPSSMSKDHIGAHTDQTTYIGWSKATLTIGNQVLYIARDNFHKLTSSDIPKCTMTSCAGVYYNDSASNISFKLGDAFSTASSYGYLIVSSTNTIKTVSTDSSSTITVTLQPKETLVMVRYLDRLINNNPFSNITDIKVGTSAYITTYDDVVVTPKEEGEKVVALINTIPTNVTLNDEELINEINEAYKALSDEAKQYVSNYNKLKTALEQIASLKNTIRLERETAIKALNNYVNFDNYSSTNQVEIKTIIQNFTNAINKATTIEEITTLKNQAVTKIDQVKTLKQEIEEYLDVELNKLNNYVNLDDYSLGIQTKIKQIITDCKTKLIATSALTKIIIDEEILKAKSKIDSLPTFEEELKDAIDDAVSELTNYAERYTYSKDNQSKIDQLLYEGIEELNSVQKNDEIELILNQYKSAIDLVPTLQSEIELMHKKAIEELNNYFKSLNLYETIINDENLMARMNQVIKNGEVEIKKYNTQTRIDQIVNITKEKINLLEKQMYCEIKVKELQQTINYDSYSEENQEIIKNIIDSIVLKVENETTYEQIDNYVNDSKTKINSILTIKEENEKELNEYRDNIKNYINSLNTENLRTDQIEKINDLKSEYLEKLDLATSKADMDNLKQEVETKYDTIINSSTPNPSNDGCNCKTASAIVITLTTAITLLAFVLRKKK